MNSRQSPEDADLLILSLLVAKIVREGPIAARAPTRSDFEVEASDGNGSGRVMVAFNPGRPRDEAVSVTDLWPADGERSADALTYLAERISDAWIRLPDDPVAIEAFRTAVIGTTLAEIARAQRAGACVRLVSARPGACDASRVTGLSVEVELETKSTAAGRAVATFEAFCLEDVPAAFATMGLS